MPRRDALSGTARCSTGFIRLEQVNGSCCIAKMCVALLKRRRCTHSRVSLFALLVRGELDLAAGLYLLGRLGLLVQHDERWSFRERHPAHLDDEPRLLDR